jgi:hypothetical protein
MTNLETARLIFTEAKVRDRIGREVTEEECRAEELEFYLDIFEDTILVLDYEASYEVYEESGDYDTPPYYDLTVTEVLIENVQLYIDGDNVLTEEESAQLDREFSKR